MIGLDLGNTVVLRRALEEIEAKTKILDVPLRALPVIEEGSSTEDLVERLNQTIETVNIIINALNRSVKIN